MRHPTTPIARDSGVEFLDEMVATQVPGPRPPDDELELLPRLTAMVMEEARRGSREPTSFPAMAVRVMDRAQDRKVGTDELVTLLAQDAAISAVVLRVANTPLFRRGAPVRSMRTAIARIGLEEVRRIAAGVAARSLYDMEVVSEYRLFKERWDRMFHRSMTVAFSSGWLASALRSGAPDRAFTAGMFHDIGKTIALRSLGALIMRGKLQPMAEASVDAILEAVHVPIGVALHESWGLPEDLTNICLLHHELDLPAGAGNVELHVVRLMAALSALRVNAAGNPTAREAACTSLLALALPSNQFRALDEKLAMFGGKVSEMFDVAEEQAARI